MAQTYMPNFAVQQSMSIILTWIVFNNELYLQLIRKVYIKHKQIMLCIGAWVKLLDWKIKNNKSFCGDKYVGVVS